MPKILIVTEPPAKPEPVRFALLGGGFSMVDEIDRPADLVPRARAIGPATILIVTPSPSTALLAALAALDREEPHPVLLFTNDADPEKIDAGATAGVASYVVDGFSAKRIHTLIEVALAKFRVMQSLKKQLREAEAKLEERKLVERAKGWLMQTRKFSEEDAYHALRKLAMERQQTLAATADQMLAMAKLLQA